MKRVFSYSLKDTVSATATAHQIIDNTERDNEVKK